MKNVLIVLSGPSGVGKGTIAKLLAQGETKLSISCTTRLPRKNEINGREYFFISKEEFLSKRENDGFLEWSEHFGNFYGTPKQFVLDELKSNDILLEIDVNGGLEVKKNFEKAVLIMLLPPSLDELKNRLLKRNTEDMEQIELRMHRIEYEIGKKDLYDYVIVNDDLDSAVVEIKKIIEKEKNC